MYSYDQIRESVLAKGFVWFDDKLQKGFDVNIVGIRNSKTGNIVTNLFDDFLTQSYWSEGKKMFHQWQITTDPGIKAVKEFHNPNGVFRLKPGQYRRFWEIGLHQGKYEALRQIGTAIGWRDKNRDLTFDEVVTDKGSGINCHRSNPKTQSQYVENWSEGCQVFQKVADFNTFMEINRKARQIHGNAFTYTLLTTNDILL